MVIVSDKNVSWFDVQVDEALGVYVLNGFQKVTSPLEELVEVNPVVRLTKVILK
jgi:hypothetical protein